MFRVILFSLLLALLIAGTSSSSIIRVPQQEQTIQGGVDASRDGDTVLVGPGVYVEHVNITGRTILLASLIILTEDRAYIDSTIIDGDGNGPCVVFVNGEEINRSEIRGFTIRNGLQNWGGGIDIRVSTEPLLTDLYIVGNTANMAGGGVHCTSTAKPVITRCTFEGNSSGRYYWGGGLSAVWSANVTMRESVFRSNTSAPVSYGGSAIALAFGASGFFDRIEVNGNSDRTDYGNGAIAMIAGDSLMITNSIISGNTGRGIFVGAYEDETGGWTVGIEKTLVADNGGSGVYIVGSSGYIRNCTIANNGGDNNGNLGAYLFSVELELLNNIIYNNPLSLLAGSWYNPDGREAFNSNINIRYNNIEGGRENIRIRQDEGSEVVINWGDGNIDADPRFVDPDNGDYHLRLDSPCINTGDPASPLDANNTRADMGAFPALFLRVLSGFVVDARNNAPLANARVTGEGRVIVGDVEALMFINTRTNEEGYWSGLIPYVSRGIISLSASYRGYVTLSHEIDVSGEDSVEVNYALLVANLSVTPDSIYIEVPEGGSATVMLNVANNGNGSAEWVTAVRNRGEEGAAAWDLRRSIQVGEITGDDRIAGVVFADGRYFVSGANIVSGNDGENKIWIFDRDSALIDSFDQPGEARYGMRDIAWDGEWLWGTSDREVFAMTPQGRLERRFDGPYNPNTVIGWDSDRECLWIGAMTSPTLVAYDRDGNRLVRQLPRSGFRISGIGYYPEDSEGYNLYIAHSPSANVSQISKMNPENGDTTFVVQFLLDGNGTTGGIHITREYDRYGGWVVMLAANVGQNLGGDRIDIYQLAPFTGWVDLPDTISVESGSDIDIELTLYATEYDDGLTLEGDLILLPIGWEGDEILFPVTMRVVERSDIAGGGSLPTEFGLESVYPNPFNNQMNIVFNLTETGFTRLRLFDVCGRETASLVEGELAAGRRTAVFHAGNLPSGIYYLKLENGSKVQTRKVALLK